MRIKKEDSIGLIIDVQQKLFPLIYENEKLSINICKLINGLKALSIPLVVTEQYSKGLGNTILPVQGALGEHRHLEKMSFSCCKLDEFNKILNDSGKKNVIIAGIESHVCVLQTVTDLLEKNFKPILIEDCVSSRNPNDKRIAIDRMRNEGAIISTYESVLFELLVFSGTDEFKSISKIIK